MSTNEKKFRRVMNRIGGAMLIFLAIINVLVPIQTLIAEIIGEFADPVSADIIDQLSYGAVYLVCFMLPVPILKALLGKEDYRPMMLKTTLPSNVWAYIAVGVCATLAFAQINSNIVNAFFDYSAYSSEFLWGNEPMENYQIVLAFITTAMVPAFAEEFLFRGAILSALKPYGKAPAIVISAVLFGLMHQNSEQLLYATAAGLVLGWAVYETGSMWTGILIHFFNNFVSVINNVMIERIPSSHMVGVVYLFEAVLCVAGIWGLIFVVSSNARKKERESRLTECGFYGCELEELEDGSNAAYRVPQGKLVRGFFCPTVIIFTVLSALTMGLYIIMSILYGKGLL